MSLRRRTLLNLKLRLPSIRLPQAPPPPGVRFLAAFAARAETYYDVSHDNIEMFEYIQKSASLRFNQWMSECKAHFETYGPDVPIEFVERNEGLCGPQLNKSCSDIAETLPTSKDKHSHPKDGKKWEFLSAASVGYVVGLGFVIGPLFFCERWSKW
ncbi:hypothetical protein LguiB_005881 [Lonicera macranthoides]